MAVDRIYGNFQTAGVKVTTAAKSNVNNTGTDGYAALVGLLGADGLTLAGAANPVPMTPGTGSTFVVQGSGYATSATFTRPNDTPTYGVNDVVGAAAAALTFTGAGPSGGKVVIISASLEIDINAVPSGMTSFFLALYNVTPPSALADAATWDLPSGDRASFLGLVQLGSPVDLGSTLYVEQNSINKQIALSSANLFGYLVTIGSYTATAQAVYKITLLTAAL